jgi:molybdenum cofactor cytidylyltransferase
MNTPQTIGSIILAAGESRRMGTQKLLLPYAGRQVIQHITDAALNSRADETVVVTGYQPERIHEALDGFEITFAQNDHYPEGMLTSIRTGLAALPENLEAFMVVLGDQPSLTSTIIDFLIDGFRASEKGIAIPWVNDDSGHPIIIDATYRQEVMTKFDDTGLRGLIYGRPEEVHRLPVTDPGVLRDMDTPEDYERELRALENA